MVVTGRCLSCVVGTDLRCPLGFTPHLSEPGGCEDVSVLGRDSFGPSQAVGHCLCVSRLPFLLCRAWRERQWGPGQRLQTGILRVQPILQGSLAGLYHVYANKLPTMKNSRICFECPDCSFLLKLCKTFLPGARSLDPPLNRAQAQRSSRVPLTPRLGPSPIYVANLAPLVLELSAPALCGPLSCLCRWNASRTWVADSPWFRPAVGLWQAACPL